MAHHRTASLGTLPILAAVAAAAILTLLMLASGADAAKSKAAQTPEFATLPFALTGNGTNALGVRENDLLIFLNGTAGYTGMIEVTMVMSKGQASLAACSTEICFRGTAYSNRRIQRVASTAVTRSAQPWLLVAEGEVSDNVGWWFWLSNEAGVSAAASGTLHVKLLPTIVINSTAAGNATVEVSVAAGELRLFRMVAAAGNSLAVRVSYSEAAANSFQYFVPRAGVLPAYYFSDALPDYYVINGDLVAPQFGVAELPSAQASPAWFVQGLTASAAASVDTPTDWWLVAGSRNQQAANASLTVQPVAAQTLQSGDVWSASLAAERGAVAVARLPAVAGQSGQVRANFTCAGCSKDVVAYMSAGVLPNDGGVQLPSGVFTHGIAGALDDSSAPFRAAAQQCLWDDDATDWWLVVKRTGSSVDAAAFTLAVKQVPTLAASANGTVSFALTAGSDGGDNVYPVRLIKFGTATAGGLRLRSTDATPLWFLGAINSAQPYTWPSTICGTNAATLYGFGEPLLAASRGSPYASAAGLTLDALALAPEAGHTWYAVVATTQTTEFTGSLQFEAVPVVSDELVAGGGSNASATLFDGGGSDGTGVNYELDARIYRVSGASAPGAAGLDVTVTVARSNSTTFPGQSADNSAVPDYSSMLKVWVSSDSVVPLVIPGDGNYVNDVMRQYACGGLAQCTAALANSSAVPSVSATGRFWTEQINQLAILGVPPANLTAAVRRAVAFEQGASLAGRGVADDAPRDWYVVVLGDLGNVLANGNGGQFVTGTPFTLPLSLQAKWAAVQDVKSGVPVLSPAAPSNPALAVDVNGPLFGVQLYRVAGGAGSSGLAHVTVTNCDLGSGATITNALYVSPGGRSVGRLTTDITRSYSGLSTFDPPSCVGGGGGGGCKFGSHPWVANDYGRRLAYAAHVAYTKQHIRARLFSSGSYTDQQPVGAATAARNTYYMGDIAPVRVLRLIDSSNTQTGWLQAADNSDDDGTDWYMTLLLATNSDTDGCSITLTLQDTIVLRDDPLDSHGALVWSAAGVPVSPLTEVLFKLPARLGLRGIISDISFAGGSAAVVDDIETGPLALTLQAQTVPDERASILEARYQIELNELARSIENVGGEATYVSYDLYTSQSSAGNTFWLPFVPVSPARADNAARDERQRYTVSTGGGSAFPAATAVAALNTDSADVYLLGVSRTNVSRTISVSVTVSQTRQLCNAKLTCSDNGKCLADGSCDCDSGYGGQYCTCKDSRDCHGHGVCGISQRCVCDEGFTGADCAKSGGATTSLGVFWAVLVVLLAVAY